MQDEDYAIVVGLQTYPGLNGNGQPALSGPVNDANAFYDWLISKDGGDVDPNKIQRIRSSDFPAPAGPIFKTKPRADDIEDAFNNLKDISDANKNANKPRRIGRRLYVYMAGHGVVQQNLNVNEPPKKEAALLMANVELNNIGNSYVYAAYSTSWFCNNRCFDEVFLFMDCCKELALLLGQNYFLPNTGSPDTGVRCLMFATKASRLAREQMMDDENRVRGVFTKTLLMGLEGGAAKILPGRNDGVGQITAASLAEYVRQQMRELLPEPLKPQAGDWEPEFDFFPGDNFGANIVIKEMLMPTFPVTITLVPGATGSLSITFEGDDFIEPILVPNPLTPIVIQLPRGMYKAEVVINGVNEKRPVIVKGKGGVHVQF
jgi:hypothetical protein